ncbi:hypothetical protein OJ996_01200 [Luteolibacter sp. GHJ8]|uniref:Uncharacterized protein n=1 Tax=Luteolibacter rhizosphaerae TaxID=2989719 RepID=A0ABT3FX83_9BACT|nr:hypothetical protein [Luteolibacter rhizosphaerae]MCW1912168.1 hypothetical protein [Luteolibacter rhizosphaerae]
MADEVTAETQRSRRVAEFLIGKVVHEALEAVSEERNMKIDQKPERLSAHPEIGKQLGAVDRFESFARLQFNHDLVLHKQVDSVGVGNDQTLVGEGK